MQKTPKYYFSILIAEPPVMYAVLLMWNYTGPRQQ